MRSRPRAAPRQTWSFWIRPYATGAVPRAVDALARAGWIGPATLVCAEQARTDAPPPGELLADRTHGGTRVLVLRGSSAA